MLPSHILPSEKNTHPSYARHLSFPRANLQPNTHSGCASAVARLSFAVKYHGSEDGTYYLGGLSMWCLAEMTCAFVVFSAPALPKVFNSFGLKLTFADVLESCSTMLTKPTRHQPSPLRSWPSSAIPAAGDSAAAGAAKYHRVVEDENGIALQPLPPARVVPLPPAAGNHAHDRGLSDSSILRTTHIETSVDYVDRTRDGHAIYHHPRYWGGSV